MRKLIVNKTTLLFVFTVMLTTYGTTLSAQVCNCDHTIAANDEDIFGVDYSILPGDTICLLAGTKDLLYINGFHGDSINPVVFINYGGQVVIGNNYHHSSINVVNSSYFEITGTGDANFNYGIKLTGTGTGGSGIHLGGLSTNFNVNHLEITGSGFAGIMAKTDPSCDLTSARQNFTMRGVKIHNNYIHDVAGEGMYIGYTFYSGVTLNCNGTTVNVLPHEIEDIKIYDNLIERSGLDGIQVTGATMGCEIYGNTVSEYGFNEVKDQTNGIQIGSGTGGKCYNNLLKNGRGTGITVFGHGGNQVFNNIIIDAGKNTTDPLIKAYGIFCDDRSTIVGSSFNFMNNTIIDPKHDGIRFYSLQSTGSIFKNNVVVNPGTYMVYENDWTSRTGADAYVFVLNSNVDLTSANNFFTRDITQVEFVNPSIGDYELLSTSPLVNGGADLRSMGVTFDYTHKLRPSQGASDIGAYEFGPEHVSIPEKKTVKVSLKAYPNPAPISKSYLEFTLIESQVLEFSIYDLTGKLVASFNSENEFVKGRNQIAISKIAPAISAGNYYINLKGVDFTASTKIIITE